MPEDDICDVPMAEEDIDAIGLLLLLLLLLVGVLVVLLLVVDVVVVLLLNGEDEVGTLEVVGVDTRWLGEDRNVGSVTPVTLAAFIRLIGVPATDSMMGDCC